MRQKLYHSEFSKLISLETIILQLVFKSHILLVWNSNSTLSREKSIGGIGFQLANIPFLSSFLSLSALFWISINSSQLLFFSAISPPVLEDNGFGPSRWFLPLVLVSTSTHNVVLFHPRHLAPELISSNDSPLSLVVSRVLCIYIVSLLGCADMLVCVGPWFVVLVVLKTLQLHFCMRVCILACHMANSDGI